MKKFLIGLFSILAVIAIILVIWNFVIGGGLIQSIVNTFINRINDLWAQITGTDASSDPLIPTMAVSEETIAEDW